MARALHHHLEHPIKDHGGKVAVFNLEPMPEDTGVQADFTLLGPCEETLPAMLGVSVLPFVSKDPLARLS